MANDINSVEYWRQRYSNLLDGHIAALERSVGRPSQAPQSNGVYGRLVQSQGGREIHTWVNNAVRVSKSSSSRCEVVYQIEIPQYSQYVNLRAETVLKVISALQSLLTDTSVEESAAKGAIIINLATGEIVNR